MQAPGADVEGHYCVEARGATPNDTGLEDPDLHARSAAERLQAKFTDITTHVVLRVEYMNSYDTRVSTACPALTKSAPCIDFCPVAGCYGRSVCCNPGWQHCSCGAICKFHGSGIFL